MRTMLVTGAGHGIGEAIAKAADAAGYRVGVMDVERDAASTVAGRLQQGVPLCADVRDPDAVGAALGRARYRGCACQQCRDLANRPADRS